jgi:hypothetical protein
MLRFKFMQKNFSEQALGRILAGFPLKWQTRFWKEVFHPLFPAVKNLRIVIAKKFSDLRFAD